MISPLRNRVMRIERMRLGDLADHPRQFRTHPTAQRAAVRLSLERFGVVGVVPAFLSQRTGALTRLDGHCRTEVDPDAPDTQPDTTAAFAGELADAGREVFGGYPPRALVTATPQGASAYSGQPYAAGFLAREVAASLDLDCATLFEPFTARRHHGRHYKADEAALLRADAGPVPELVLVVDDVVTSGATMLAARAALAGPSLGVVWCWYHGEPEAGS